jgi:hypothetical protein
MIKVEVAVAYELWTLQHLVVLRWAVWKQKANFKTKKEKNSTASPLPPPPRALYQLQKLEI